MTKKILASGIMTEKIVVAGLNNNFSQLLDFFSRHKIQHLPITFDDKLLGIISINDMIRFIEKTIADGNSYSEEEFNKLFDLEKEMTHNPTTVEPETPLESILEILSEGKFQALPVVEEGLIRGIITNKDIVRVYNWDLQN
jgi:CBS domain-containing membrane protein